LRAAGVGETYGDSAIACKSLKSTELQRARGDHRTFCCNIVQQALQQKSGNSLLAMHFLLGFIHSRHCAVFFWLRCII